MDVAAFGFVEHGDNIIVVQFGILLALGFLVVQALAVYFLPISADAALDDRTLTQRLYVFFE